MLEAEVTPLALVTDQSESFMAAAMEDAGVFADVEAPQVFGESSSLPAAFLTDVEIYDSQELEFEVTDPAFSAEFDLLTLTGEEC